VKGLVDPRLKLEVSAIAARLLDRVLLGVRHNRAPVAPTGLSGSFAGSTRPPLPAAAAIAGEQLDELAQIAAAKARPKRRRHDDDRTALDPDLAAERFLERDGRLSLSHLRRRSG
jgi:hypothetical protein